MPDHILDAHPATQAFPMLSDAKLVALAEDIEARGLLDPITLFNGMVLDGRNRLRACDLVGVEPRFVEYDGDEPVAFVRSKNLRRDLNKGQRAMASARLLPMLEEEARKRSSKNLKKGNAARGGTNATSGASGHSAEQVGAIMDVSGRYVRMAKRVLKESPVMAAKVESGDQTLTSAFRSLDSEPQDSPPDPPPRKARSDHKPRVERIEQIAKLAAEGHRAAQIAEKIGLGLEQVRNIANSEGIELSDKAIGKVHRINARRVIEETVHGLAGYASGLGAINGSMSDVDRSDAGEWARSLAESLKPINTLRKQLLEHAHGNS